MGESKALDSCYTIVESHNPTEVTPMRTALLLILTLTATPSIACSLMASDPADLCEGMQERGSTRTHLRDLHGERRYRQALQEKLDMEATRVPQARTFSIFGRDSIIRGQIDAE